LSVPSSGQAMTVPASMMDRPIFLGIVSRSSVLALIIDMLFIGESKMESKAVT
jgi:hypothetical protein